MLAENLQHWAEKERKKGEIKGELRGELKGKRKTQLKLAQNLLESGLLTDEQIASFSELSLKEVIKLKNKG